MDEPVTEQYTAFAGSRRIASGSLATVALAARAACYAGSQEPVLVFDDVTSQVVDVDLRGEVEDVAARYGSSAGAASSSAAGGDDVSPYRESLTPRGRGRPK